MYKLYIVEDDGVIADGIASLADSWGYEAVVCKDFRHVTEEFASLSPQMVLLDIMLPFFDGYHWCAELRKVSSVPILFISSASDNMNMIMAMNMGADDFVVKPFDAAFLMAKVQALLRRTYDFVPNAPLLTHKGAALKTDDGTLVYDGRKIELTKNEYRILLCLMENKGKVVSRERLMERLWETDSFVDENTLTVNINRLRKKLSGEGLNDFIGTKVGVGYILE